MTGLGIFLLTGKRHDQVVRDIEKMLNDIGEGLPKFGGTYINEQNGQECRCYNLPKNLTLNLVTGYRADMRLKIIDRWLELEGDPENRATSEVQTWGFPMLWVSSNLRRGRSHLSNAHQIW